jgi:dipeptidyl aminopeptidase/acylaminoacyl peptidase
MKRHARGILHASSALWLLLVLSQGLAAAPTPPPTPPAAEAFGRLPALQFAAISPDGRWLARDLDRGGQPAVAIIEVGTGKVQSIIGTDPVNKLRGLEWADDATLLIHASAQQAWRCNQGWQRCNYEWLRTFAVGRDAGEPQLLLLKSRQRQYVTGAEVLAARTERPGSVTMVTLDYKPSYGAALSESRAAAAYDDNTYLVSIVFDVDTKTGKGRPIAVGTPYTQDWAVNAQGNPIARSEWIQADGSYSLVALDGKNWREIYRHPADERFRLVGLTPDGSAAVVLALHDDGQLKAMAVPLDGSATRILHEVAGDDVDVAVVDEKTHAVVGLSNSGTGASEFWLDAKERSRRKVVANAYPGQKVEILSQSADGQRLVVSAEKESRPPVLSLVDLDRARADVISAAYPELANVPLGTVRHTTYPARDGTRIPAFITLPPGSDGRNLPLVVLPHGGPESNDVAGFDWLAQFLATRGYAVLQPQFRGSTGYGEAHRQAGRGEWGGLMQDDVTDGVKFLVGEGTADPKRVCIVGASYGGYAALAGAAFTPELYACAASINGVSDLPQLIDSQRRRGGNESGALAYWLDHIGSPSDPKVASKSPARSASTFRAPVLLMHGREDAIVPLQQSQLMAEALGKAGKPATFVVLDGEDHWLSRSTTRIQVLHSLEDFLARHLQSSAP